MNAPLHSKGNGNGKVIWWIISTLTGLVLGVGSSSPTLTTGGVGFKIKAATPGLGTARDVTT